MSKGLQIPNLQSYQARDGEHLPYRYYPSKADKVMILLHGMKEDSTYLHSLATHISNRNLAHVYTPDLRGYGERPKKRGDIQYIGQHEDDLLDLIKEVQKKHEYPKILLAGHSAGGGTILRLIENERDEVIRGFLLIAPFIHPTSSTVRKNNIGTMNMRRLIVLFLLNRLGIRFFNHTIVYTYNKKINQPGTPTAALSLRLFVSRYPKNYFKALSNMSKPTLVLVGELDKECDHKEIESLFDEEAQTKTIPNTDHYGILEDEKAMDEIEKWIESVE